MPETKQLVILIAVGVVAAVIGIIIGRYAVSPSASAQMSSVADSAQCVLQSDTGVAGTLSLSRNGESITISGTVTGLPTGKHGFHVHHAGNLGNGCKASKGHFNPFNMHHGSPQSSERHVGDLGNIEAAGDSTASVNIADSVIKFYGAANVLGRAIVIHGGMDDMGTGGDEGSKKTGNAGPRLACCIIGVL